MRLELHDAALSQEWQGKQQAAAAEEEAGGVQRSGLSGRLRGALSSLSGSKVPSSRILSAGVDDQWKHFQNMGITSIHQTNVSIATKSCALRDRKIAVNTNLASVSSVLSCTFMPRGTHASLAGAVLVPVAQRKLAGMHVPLPSLEPNRTYRQSFWP